MMTQCNNRGIQIAAKCELKANSVRKFIITHDSGILVNFIAKIRVIVGFSQSLQQVDEIMVLEILDHPDQLTSSLNKVRVIILIFLNWYNG
jgi:hypothetical protein